MSLGLIESIDVLNRRLLEYYGRFENGEQNWKLFWSEDFLEKKLCNETENGILLLTPEIRTVKKVNYIQNKYVLTKLVAVPERNRAELLGAKTSYEPMWTFEDLAKNPIIPDWGGIKAIIDTALENFLNAKHKAPEQMPEFMHQTEEARRDRVEKIMEQFYGNESSITDSLALDSGVGYGVRKRNDWLH